MRLLNQLGQNRIYCGVIAQGTEDGKTELVNSVRIVRVCKTVLPQPTERQ